MTGRGERLGREASGESTFVERPRLDEAFEGGRVHVVMGVAGWGKTTAVASWSRRHRTVWLHPREGGHDARWVLDALGQAVPADDPGPQIEPMKEGSRATHIGATVSAVCDWLRDRLTSELVLVVDDFHRLSATSEAVGVIEGLCWSAPAGLHVVIVSPRELPFPLTGLEGQGLLRHVDASDLALSTSEIEVLLHRRMGEDAGPLAESVREWTGGWPAAVRIAVEALCQGDGQGWRETLAQLVHPGGWFHTYLTNEVIGAEQPLTQELLRRTAIFGEITSPAAAGLESQDPIAVLADLARRGLLVHTPGEMRWTLLPPLADYFRHESAVPRNERAGLHAAAAGEYMARGAYAEALQHLVAAGDQEATALLLIDHGPALVSKGDADAVLHAAELGPHYLDDERLQQTLGEAQQARGHWAAAFESYRRAGGDEEGLEPRLAWRIMWMLQMQGEFSQVPALFNRVTLRREDTLDEAWVLAQVAGAHRLQGDFDCARKFAERALEGARRCGLPSAFAPANNVLAMLAAAAGDRRKVDAYFSTAMNIAEAENDLMQLSWLRICRALNVLEMGSPRDAAAEIDAMQGLLRKGEVPFLDAVASYILARANLRLGDVDTASAHFETATELFQRLGSRLLAWPLAGLGDLYRTRGQLSRARAAYEAAHGMAVDGVDSIGLSHALMGLARVRAADDLELASSLADRAVAVSEGLHEVGALLTRGWVALLRGDRTSAAHDAVEAGAAARRRLDDLGLAEAITLGVQASDDYADAESLDEAIQICEEAGCRLEAAVIRLVGARITGAGGQLEQARAVRTLGSLGVDVESRRAAGPLAASIRSKPGLHIRTLGVFQIVRDGVPVPKGAWQSKKARDLLKILIARRRPTPRDTLQELLWPDSDPNKSGNRLSVLLSGVRDVLQPDRPDAGPLVSDGGSVWLDLSRMRVDVEEFLEHAVAALNAHRRRDAGAEDELVAALALYTGGFLEDDPYEEWATPLAEEVRTTHTALLRALIGAHRESGDVDEVIKYGLRLLEQDPYDEEVHLDLVAALLDAGRLGEARRHYGVYVRRMREIDVEPVPMPQGSRGGSGSNGPD